MFQHFALIDDYTVFENVEVPLLKQAISKAERKKKVLSALKTVGISELAGKSLFIYPAGKSSAWQLQER